ncbi:MAG: hypothetical protein KBS62_01175 [Oscillospiraceae bacterium]|nr:hypothetical protein [Candidatus Ruminococcus equi]
MQVQGYKKKTKAELLKAIENCVSISQLCALVQHEHIEIRMRCQQGASNIPMKKLTAKDFIPNRSPLEKMKDEIRQIVENQR